MRSRIVDWAIPGRGRSSTRTRSFGRCRTQTDVMASPHSRSGTPITIASSSRSSNYPGKSDAQLSAVLLGLRIKGIAPDEHFEYLNDDLLKLVFAFEQRLDAQHIPEDTNSQKKGRDQAGALR